MGLVKLLAAVKHIGRRIRRAYVLACAREDALRHGFAVPDGTWHCAPCGRTFFDRRTFTLHGPGCGGALA
jgi:transposase-like protein